MRGVLGQRNGSRGRPESTGRGGVCACVRARRGIHRRHGRGTERGLLCVHLSGACTSVSRGVRRACLARWAEVQQRGVLGLLWSGVDGMDMVGKAHLARWH